MTEYDPDTCVTAGELRALGAEGIPDDVPDCAWIPRAALIFDGFRPATITADGTVTGTSSISIRAPWRWVEATVTFTPKDPP